MKNKSLILSMIALVLVVAIGLSYSYFTAKVNENNKTETDIKVADLSLTFNGETEINAEDILPGESFTKTFNVVNNTAKALTYNIYMESIENTIGKDIVYTLSDDNGEIVTNKSMPSTADKKYLLKKLSIDANTTVNYTMEVTLIEKEDEDQSGLMGKGFKGTLGIDTTIVPTAANLIKMSESYTPSTVLNFSQPSSSSNGQGLYVLASTMNDKYPIYFYRGNISNNYVNFANYCWRIVRTTNTGGVKMIYSGASNEEGQCLNSTGYISFGVFDYSNSATYISSTGVNSTAKGIIDTWYFNNIVKYQAYLEDTQFCEAVGTYSGRICNGDEPKLTCEKQYAYTVSDEIGNGLLTYPVSMLMAEEANLAGLTLNGDGGNYLGKNYWLLGTDGNGRYMHHYDRMQYGSANGSEAIRPVISLNNNVELSGNGTPTNPYVVEE